jgi:hypothetical protein
VGQIKQLVSSAYLSLSDRDNQEGPNITPSNRDYQVFLVVYGVEEMLAPGLLALSLK